MGMYVLEPLVLKYILLDQYYDFPILVARQLEPSQRVEGDPAGSGTTRKLQKRPLWILYPYAVNF
jgi:hypothetical protein